MAERRKSFSLTGAQLKWIAMLTMVIDHVGACLIEPWLNHHAAGSLLLGISFTHWQEINTVLRAIGRIAFPIYCFLIVEGVHYTRDWRKYALRLGIFALISEIPFDLAVFQQPLCGQTQNVFFTLCLGVVMLGIYENTSNRFIQLLDIVIIFLLSELLKTDYAGTGVLLILILYLVRDQRFLQSVLGSICMIYEGPTVIISFILTYFYNGERGRGNSKILYWFYPVHLFILYLIYSHWLAG